MEADDWLAVATRAATVRPIVNLTDSARLRRGSSNAPPPRPVAPPRPGMVASAEKQLRAGWAFGLGLERLAMVLFAIPDIRLFWTDDERFHKQFKEGTVSTFKPYSKYPPVFKDIAFWIPDGFEPNDFFEPGRAVAGELPPARVAGRPLRVLRAVARHRQERPAR